MSYQTVTAHFQLSDDHVGDAADAGEFYHLAGRLASLVEREGIGQFDGDEFADGQCAMFLYGPDADILFNTIAPVLRSSSFARHARGRVVKNYGGPCPRRVSVLINSDRTERSFLLTD